MPADEDQTQSQAQTSDQTNTKTEEPDKAPTAPEQPEAKAPENGEQPTTTEQSEAQPEAPAKAEEEVDLGDYFQERYQAPPQGQSPSLVDEVSQELAQLPTDETGTVEARAAAEWFANKMSEVSTRAEQAAVQRAQQVFMENAAEEAQQRQLLKKYPEITKDRDTLDAIFDLRDAAAIRGKNLSLTEAASRLEKLRRDAKTEGEQSASRRTTIEATAHLETSGIKDTEGMGDRQRLAAAAFQGSGQDATNARRALLRQFVENEIKEGRIEHP